MRTVKKLLSVLLALLLLLAATPAAFAAGPFGEIGADPDTFPEVFDLRDVDGISYVTPVKSQSPFGTCWGFAAIASAETSILSSGLAAQLGYTAETLDLSEKHLAYFAQSVIDDEEDPQFGEGMISLVEDSGTDPSADRYATGGFPFFATGLFAAGTGPVLEEADEQLVYRGKNGNTVTGTDENEELCDYSYSPDDDWSIDEDLRWTQSFVLKESYVVDPPTYNGEEDEESWRAQVNAVKDLLFSGHAVQVGFCADTSKPGQEAMTQYVNTDHWAHYTDEKSEANHAVTIVGWDDHYPRENFAHPIEGWEIDEEANTAVLTTMDSPIPEHDGAWLVKNSWGSEEQAFPNRRDWGLLQGQDKGVYNEETGKYEYDALEGAVHTGYFWLSYEDHSMCMLEALEFDLVTAMEGYYVAEHDYMPVESIRVQVQDEPVQMANVFSVDEGLPPVRLDWVSCQTGSPNTRARFDVYLLEDGAALPTEGTRVSGAEAEYPYAGFHKVLLDTPVWLYGGQRFSVVLTQEVEEDGRTGYSFNVQTNLTPSGAELRGELYYASGVVNPGESLFLFRGAWHDLADPITQAALLQDALDPGRRKNVLDNFPIKAYLAIPGPEGGFRFADEPRDARSEEALRWAAEKGVAAGTPEGLFLPEEGCTRAQAVSFLWRAAGCPAPETAEDPFEDLDQHSGAYPAALWAFQQGIVKGTAPGRFAPEEIVSRAQMAALLYRCEQAAGGGFTGVWAYLLDDPDAAEVPEWAYEAFCWLRMIGILSETDGLLRPREACTRAGAVELLYRYFDLK